MENYMFTFCKCMFQLNVAIEDYVTLGAITADQYQQITGKPYVAA